MKTKEEKQVKFCRDTSVVCKFHAKNKPCGECVDTTKANNYLLKTLQPKSGEIKGVAVNMDYFAFLMEEYASILSLEKNKRIKELEDALRKVDKWEIEISDALGYNYKTSEMGLFISSVLSVSALSEGGGNE